MIDYFALALTHGLLLVMLLRLMVRTDLDHEEPLGEVEPLQDAPPPPNERARRKARRGRAASERGDA